MKEWLITDTHFDHDNIGVYCARPDGWMDLILENWRKIVQPEDVIIHLGDVKVGGNRGHKLTEIMYSLPGTKILIRGNHDHESNMYYMRNGFAASLDGMKYHGVTFTHQPVNSLYDGTDLNIHGHVHNSKWEPTKPFHRLLAIEYVDYRPVDLMKFIGLCRSKKWDEWVKSWKPRPAIDQKAHNARRSL
jgi:calcineurin-like phosphoesterase family protein